MSREVIFLDESNIYEAFYLRLHKVSLEPALLTGSEPAFRIADLYPVVKVSLKVATAFSDSKSAGPRANPDFMGRYIF